MALFFATTIDPDRETFALSYSEDDLPVTVVRGRENTVRLVRHLNKLAESEGAAFALLELHSLAHTGALPAQASDCGYTCEDCRASLN